MEKRTKLALLIIVALLLLLLGLYFLLSPFLGKNANQQPPSLPGSVTPYVPPPNGAINIATGTAPVVPVSDQMLLLQNAAKATVERIGSGENTNGFPGYHDVLLQLTTTGQAQMVAEQRKMQEAHPATSTTYGISTRAISATTMSGSSGDATIVISVDAIQRVDTGDPTASTVKPSGKRVSVTFVKQADGAYLIDAISWTDFAL